MTTIPTPATTSQRWHPLVSGTWSLTIVALIPLHAMAAFLLALDDLYGAEFAPAQGDGQQLLAYGAPATFLAYGVAGAAVLAISTKRRRLGLALCAVSSVHGFIAWYLRRFAETVPPSESQAWLYAGSRASDVWIWAALIPVIVAFVIRGPHAWAHTVQRTVATAALTLPCVTILLAPVATTT